MNATNIELPLDAINEPALAMRERFDDAELLRLSSSIDRFGLINPITVVRRGARYEIAAGHRRYIAHKMIGRLTIPCRVVEDADASPELLKVHENTRREDVNAGEEARYYLTLYERHCDRDIRKVAELVGESEAYIEQRLTLATGDADIFAALLAGQVNFSVARELSFFKDVGYRRASLEWAIAGGATARAVRQQRLNVEATLAQQTAPGDGAASSTPAPQLPGSHLLCFICEEDADHHEIEYLAIHRSCKKAILRPFLRGLNAPQ